MAHTIIQTQWIVILMLCLWLKFQILVIHGQQVPCLFFLGDSLYDNGNNNMLNTAAKTNYQPYGIDYPGGPTGRFTNNKNIPDYLAQLLGFVHPIPPFSTVGSGILKGVNYASGGSGILDDSGKALGNVISLNKQLLNHEATINSLKVTFGATRTYAYLHKCLYAVNMGSNDYLNNYLQPRNYQSSKLFTPDQFAEHLIQQYSQQLKTLYNGGARKVAVSGLGMLGCVPQVLTKNPVSPSGCVDNVNNYVQLFNNRLKPLVDNLNANLPGAKFTYLNTTGISLTLNVAALGVKVFNAPCCVVSSGGQCVANKVPCSNRDQYVFYDNFHPTDIIDRATAARLYNAASHFDASPFDINHLAQQ